MTEYTITENRTKPFSVRIEETSSRMNSCYHRFFNTEQEAEEWIRKDKLKRLTLKTKPPESTLR